MLGIGTGLLHAAGAGAGGGGGAFDPSQLTDPVGVYEMFDPTSLFPIDQLNIANGSFEPMGQPNGPWNNWTSVDNLAVVTDKAGLRNAGVS